MVASSSSCFVVVFVSVLLQFSLVSASTKPIDAICQKVTDKAFCVKTLTAYSPVASATDTIQAANATINQLAKSYAEKSMKLIEKAAKENPKLKNEFMECRDAYRYIVTSLWSSSAELKISPLTANYDAMICTDYTTRVTVLVGKNSDDASKTIMKMTMMMNRLISFAVGATLAVPQGN